MTRSHKRSSMGPSRSCWNGRTSALQPEEITSKGTRVSLCVISIKVAIRKKSGNFFNDPSIYIYIYICYERNYWNWIRKYKEKLKKNNPNLMKVDVKRFGNNILFRDFKSMKRIVKTGMDVRWNKNVFGIWWFCFSVFNVDFHNKFKKFRLFCFVIFYLFHSVRFNVLIYFHSVLLKKRIPNTL